jgi:hypothetical protein
MLITFSLHYGAASRATDLRVQCDMNAAPTGARNLRTATQHDVMGSHPTEPLEAQREDLQSPQLHQKRLRCKWNRKARSTRAFRQNHEPVRLV